MTSPLAAPAPSRRVLISPSLFLVLRMRTFGNRTMYSSSAAFRCSAEVKTETCKTVTEGAQWVQTPSYCTCAVKLGCADMKELWCRIVHKWQPHQHAIRQKRWKKNWTISSHHQTRHLLMPHAANSNVSRRPLHHNPHWDQLHISHTFLQSQTFCNIFTADTRQTVTLKRTNPTVRNEKGIKSAPPNTFSH